MMQNSIKSLDFSTDIDTSHCYESGFNFKKENWMCWASAELYTMYR